MPRLQILALAMALLTSDAWASCRIRAVGRLRFVSAQPGLVVFAKSLGEVQLKILPAPDTDRGELMLHLLGAMDRKISVNGTCNKMPDHQRGEIVTDSSRVRLNLPNALKPNDGDEVEVESD